MNHDVYNRLNDVLASLAGQLNTLAGDVIHRDSIILPDFLADANLAGQTALLYAAGGSHADVFNVAILSGVDISCYNREWTPHYSIAAGHQATTEVLLRQHANESNTIPSKTALVLAEERGHADVIDALQRRKMIGRYDKH
ncbi:hypothetical protein ON010_g17400 [Phytophthora cinnamomi]|nr:hypothetical protein ON010_g17400 [Phytophthora cinnamomi]